MAENKNPFTGLLGITSFNDGAVIQSAIIEGATPYCLTPSTGGYSGQYYIPVGGGSTLLSLFAGPPPASAIDKNSFWVVEFGAADNSGNELFSGSQFCGHLETILSQQYTNIFSGKRYVFDTNAVINTTIINGFQNVQLSIKLWELNK